jgi:hypothetical protein
MAGNINEEYNLQRILPEFLTPFNIAGIRTHDFLFQIEYFFIWVDNTDLRAYDIML